MQDHSTTPGLDQPGVDQHVTIEQILSHLCRELPPLTLPGLTIGAEVLPYAVLGQLKPLCTWITPDGEHPVRDPLVWKDLETDQAYCSVYCAVRDALSRMHPDDREPAITTQRVPDA